jgi:VanZ family protein
MVYFGLRGRSLTIVMSVIAATDFALQGYDQAVANGLLTLPTFLQTFPETKDPTIQGELNPLTDIVRYSELSRLVFVLSRHHCRHL